MTRSFDKTRIRPVVKSEIGDNQDLMQALANEDVEIEIGKPCPSFYPIDCPIDRTVLLAAHEQTSGYYQICDPVMILSDNDSVVFERQSLGIESTNTLQIPERRVRLATTAETMIFGHLRETTRLSEYFSGDYDRIAIENNIEEAIKEIIGSVQVNGPIRLSVLIELGFV